MWCGWVVMSRSLREAEHVSQAALGKLAEVQKQQAAQQAVQQQQVHATAHEFNELLVGGELVAQMQHETAEGLRRVQLSVLAVDLSR